jgi:peptidoglycan/LPS O-acetylase OafA/YrhL
VLALGLLAAALMIATEFSTMQSIRIGDSTCGTLTDPQRRDDCQILGGEQHSYSLLVLGVFTGLLAFGAAVGRSRPAAYAMGGIGLVVLFIALVLDRPTLNDVRGFDVYDRVDTVTGGAYTLEIIAGVLALVACGAALLRERLRPQEAVGGGGSSRARPRARGARSASDDEPAPDPAA